MEIATAPPQTTPVHPPGFRPRRGLNWAFLGLLYTSYYMCRYNLSIANKTISNEYNYSRGDMGWIITTNLLAYAVGQIVNGLLTDKIGGRRAMLIGAAGTIFMNILFGAASFWGILGLFVAIWGLNGYLQSLGAPGMVKINAAWFARRERGRFAGIYGFMINLGRFGIFKLGPALLAGFLFLGMIQVGPLHWRWLFWAPSIICAIVAVGVWFVVKETPEEAGFHHMAEATETAGVADGENPRSQVWFVFITIVSNPAIWVTASAYACTGAVRQAVDQWFPRYMEEVHLQDLAGARFQWLGFLIPFVASVGSLASGYISDLFFKSRRAPVAAALYIVETLIILSAAQFVSVDAAIVFFVLISLTANSTHSLLGTAAAMDIGGRKMSGFSSGVIDSFQYFGGSLAGYLLGMLVDNAGWETYFYFMAPFGVIGCLLMVLMAVGGVKSAESTRSNGKAAWIVIGLIIVILVASIVVGVSAHQRSQTHLPTSIARAELQHRVQRDSNSQMKLVEYHNVTLTEVTPGIYRMGFSAIVDVLGDCRWRGATTGPGIDFHADPVNSPSANPSTSQAAETAPAQVNVLATKGQHITVEGTATFEHTADGWACKIQ